MSGANNNVNPPLFASANNKSSGSPGDPPAWLMEGSDPLDVDLLAEYLLDDGKAAPNGMTFDFSIENQNNAVVTPEQSEDGGFPPVAEGNNHQKPSQDQPPSVPPAPQAPHPPPAAHHPVAPPPQHAIQPHPVHAPAPHPAPAHQAPAPHPAPAAHHPPAHHPPVHQPTAHQPQTHQPPAHQQVPTHQPPAHHPPAHAVHAHHPPAAHPPIQHIAPAPTAMGVPPPLGSPVPVAPAPPGYAPAPAPPVYAPVPSAPPVYAPVPAPAPAVYAAPQPVQALAPAPPVTAPIPAPINGSQHLVVHQHGNYAKRQRIDAHPAAVAVPGVSPVPSAPPVAATSSIVPRGQQLVDAAAAAMQTGGRGRKKSQAQIDRRRERNRILARRTRLRKKFFFESLQKEVMDLQRQNAALKDLVKSKFSMEESRKVLETCKAAEKLPESVVEACGEHAAEMDQQDFNLVRSVQQSQHSFIITDPCLQDNPIVFASDGFLKVTGYAREDVLGRNCRFLQGAQTSKAKLDQIRRGVSAAEDVTVTMVNYMADGTPFWNKLFIAALRDSSNNIVNFIGVVVKVAGPPEGDPECGTVLAEDAQANSNGKAPDTESVEANAIAADGTVKAIEGAVSAAVAAAQMP